MDTFQILDVIYLKDGRGIIVKTDGLYNNYKFCWNSTVNSNGISWKNNILSIDGIPYKDGFNYLEEKKKSEELLSEITETSEIIQENNQTILTAKQKYYIKMIDKYRDIQQSTAGTGSEGLTILLSIYDELTLAYDCLSSEEQKYILIPKLRFILNKNQ